MLFISTSGVLGRYILLSVPIIIGVRAILACILLGIYCYYRNISFKINKKDLPIVLLSGALMGVHWVSYFYALKWSNVAIGMLSIFTYPILTAFLEPILLKTKFHKIHLLLAILVLSGIYFLIPDFNIQNSYTLAIGMGVFSALAYALRNLMIKSKVAKYNGSLLMTYQTAVIGILLAPVYIFADFSAIIDQLVPLVTLALLTTAIGHTLFLLSFKNFTVTTASILSSVQPVYGVIIAMIFLKEYPSLSTVFGGFLILTAVIIESVRNYR